jgi:hypothetical protein
VASVSASVGDKVTIAHLLAVRSELARLICLVPPERALLINSTIRPVEAALHELGWKSPAEKYPDP